MWVVQFRSHKVLLVCIRTSYMLHTDSCKVTASKPNSRRFASHMAPALRPAGNTAGWRTVSPPSSRGAKSTYICTSYKLGLKRVGGARIGNRRAPPRSHGRMDESSRSVICVFVDACNSYLALPLLFPAACTSTPTCAASCTRGD